VVLVLIGATLISSIVLTSTEESKVERGEEHGYFAFGGSTVIVLFRKDSIEFDEDLIINSNKPIETLVRMGERIGIAK